MRSLNFVFVLHMMCTLASLVAAISNVTPFSPTVSPLTSTPSKSPSSSPTTASPSISPTTSAPSKSPSISPTTATPSLSPLTSTPSKSPSLSPVTSKPSFTPSHGPTTAKPTTSPSISPSRSSPTHSPTTAIPTISPSTSSPTRTPTLSPVTSLPTISPTVSSPTISPTTQHPSATPTLSPSTSIPTATPSTTNPSSTPSFSPSTSAPTPSRPKHNNNRTNILIILADDLGFGDVGYNGGRARTPFIDSLAKSPHTIVFDSMHSTPVCSPSRAMLYFGQYPDRICVSGVKMDIAFRPVRGLESIGFDARRSGYKSAFFGKWHLGPVSDNLLGEVGFDEWTASYSNIFTYDPTCFCENLICNRRPMRECTWDPRCFRSSNKVCSAKSTLQCTFGHLNAMQYLGTPPLEDTRECDFMKLVNGSQVEQANVPRNGIASQFLADRFESFVTNLDASDVFLAVMALPDVHHPFVGDPINKQNVSIHFKTPFNSALADYLTCIETFDRVVGRVQTLLRDVGRAENTLMFVLSDNGPGYHPARIASTGGLRNWKGSIFEGGIRVPGLVYWPAMIKTNAVVSEVTSLVDLRPTIRDLLSSEDSEATFPEDRMDGESLLPLIYAPGNWTRTSALLVCAPRRATVPGSKEICKYYAYFSHGYKIIAERNREFIRNNRNNFMFKLDTDRGERKNIIKNQKAMFKSLANRAKALVKDVMIPYNHKKCGY